MGYSSNEDQPSPDGLAQAFILAEEFDGAPSAMVLGDTTIFGHDPTEIPRPLMLNEWRNCFRHHVSDPERYGVVAFDENGTVQSIIEKPEIPPSNYAVTGLYFVDGSAPKRAKQVKPSARGELITSLLQTYLLTKYSRRKWAAVRLA